MKQHAFFLFILLPVTASYPGTPSNTVPKTADENSAVRAHKTSVYAAHTIGESYGGGVVFYVSDDGQHGLIAAHEDQNPGVPFYNGLTRFAGAESDGLGAGAANTRTLFSKLIADDEKGSFAAKSCTEYSVKADGKTYKDWYLPSKFELNLLYQQKAVVGGFANTNYWSSTEYKTNSIWIQEFGTGHQRVSNSESYANAVRAIRKF